MYNNIKKTKMSFDASPMNLMTEQLVGKSICGNLTFLQEEFKDDKRVSFVKDGFALNINFLSLSSAAEDLVRPLLIPFSGAEKNKISFYLSLGRGKPTFMTILFVHNGQFCHSLNVDQWGYSQPRCFAYIDEVIEEIQRMITLIC